MQASLSLKKLQALAMFAAVLMATVLLGGCNTIEGAGKDIERAGEEIQDATN